MADACHRHARRLSYALHCAILTTRSLYIVGSIAFRRRGAAILAIVATFPLSELLLTS